MASVDSTRSLLMLGIPPSRRERIRSGRLHEFGSFVGIHKSLFFALHA
jgi:hypothetical protein